MNLSKLSNILSTEPKYRLLQVNEFIYGKFISDWEMAFSLPKALREKLKENCPLEIDSNILKSATGETQKALITMSDGSKIESVLMSYGDNHHTVCVSCQVGCGMNCDFCATGKMGLKRSLSSEEIILQVLFFSRLLKEKKQRVSNVVFMGMGEPFANYDNVMEAVETLNHPRLFNISARKISISTCGIVSGIEKIANEPIQVNLAISLHSSNNKLREEIMPINKQYNIEKMLTAVREYIEKTNRKVMIEYILLKDINDSKQDAEELSSLLKNFLITPFMVNLIVYNATDGKYRSSSKQDVLNFKKILESNGIATTQRYSLGHDVKGACGQLATD